MRKRKMIVPDLGWEQECYRLRRELKDARADVTVAWRIAQEYRNLVTRLWDRLDLPAAEVQTQLSLMEGAISADNPSWPYWSQKPPEGEGVKPT